MTGSRLNVSAVGLLVVFEITCFVYGAAQGTACPSLMTPDCDPAANQDLYPETYLVYGAFSGQVYTVGNVIMIVAKFPDGTCNLPDPTTLGPECVPTIVVSLFTESGTCFNVSAASVKVIEYNFGFSFADNPILETDNGIYNHWVFPLYVVGGMSTSRLDVKALIIPAGCNSERAQFENSNQITKAIRLSPTVTVDTAAPEIVSIHTGKASGVYTNGTVINIVMEMSKDVALSTLPGQYSHIYTDMKSNKIPYGIPYIAVNSNALVPLLGYASTQSKRRISFLYQVGVGEETPPGMQLDVPAGHSIVLNGGSIVSYGTGVDVNLTTMPLPGSEGSLSHPTANKIYIIKTGEKFPPLQYDPNENPITEAEGEGVPARIRNLEIRKQAKATKISVDLDLKSLAVDEGLQSFTAEFNLITSWTDLRLKNPKANTIIDYSMQMLDSNQIWSPKLIFTNGKDIPEIVEAIVNVSNTGNVVVAQRFIGNFAADLDMRGFPFDEPTFTWRLRSAMLDKSVVKFSSCAKEECSNASARHKAVSNPHFAFVGYTQKTKALTSGAYKGFDTTSIHIRAARVTTQSTIFLIAPLGLIWVVLCLVLYQDPSKGARLSVPVYMIAATVAFSFVVVSVSPSVSYVTRLHLLVFQTNCFSLVVLVCNYYLFAICEGRRELAEANLANKKLLKDAYWLAKNVNPAPRDVVVLPGGVHKPLDADDEGAKRGRCLGSVGPGDDCAPLRSRPQLDALRFEQVPTCSYQAVPPDSSSTASAAPSEVKADGVDLLDSEEVRALKRLSWSGPVRLFGGLALITNANSEAWRAHVRVVDGVLRLLLPCLCALAFACALALVDVEALSSRAVLPDTDLLS